ncbi:Serine/threonine exchanger SteT [bioreactor metagenome]|uniref:Serine/threonine exchanger SteT n=1 Tax=bioreactor metagenome TaxID=1076179 RepID=A0A645DDV4_9ZZZZ
MLVGDPDRLTDIAMFIIQVFYIFAFVAVFILRSRYPQSEKTYRVPLYPLIPVIAIIGAVYIVGSTLFNNPTDTMYALAITGAGIPVYVYLTKKTVND